MKQPQSGYPQEDFPSTFTRQTNQEDQLMAGQGFRLSRAARRVIVVSTIGNALEWFDFLVYGFFASLIAQQFFPHGNPTAAMLATWATFGVGFLTRPLGGIVIGTIGDRAGRKAALTLTILLMAVGLACIAFAPTYAQIGIGAPLLVLVGRFFQGFSAGGEMGCATAYLVEFAPPSRRGYVGSFQMVAQATAGVMGSLAGVILTHTLSADALLAFGWRIPFVLGLCIVPVGLYLRRSLEESPVFARAQAAGQLVANPAASALTRDWRRILVACGLTVFPTIGMYIFLIYMPAYATHVLHMSLQDSLFSSLLGSLCYALSCPALGMLSDKLGRRRLMFISTGVVCAIAYPLYANLNAHPTLPTLLLSQATLMLVLSIYEACYPAFVTELMPVNVRSTAISISYNVGVMIFGGFAPVFVQWLTGWTHNPLAICYYVVFGSLVTIGALIATGSMLRTEESFF